MNFPPQEVTNDHFGSALTARPDRMTAAGLHGTPQMVAPGCYDLVDVVVWQPPPDRFRDRPVHAHNRLLSSYLTSADVGLRAFCATNRPWR